MLPDVIKIVSLDFKEPLMVWIETPTIKALSKVGFAVDSYVYNTELLHLCWLVEETLPIKADYMKALYYETAFDKVCDEYDGTDWTAVYCYALATWKQRTIALCKVKGIEIV